MKEKTIAQIWMIIITSFVLAILVSFGYMVYSEKYLSNNYPLFYDYSSDPYVYKEGMFCFPGDRVILCFVQKTIEGAHIIKNTSIVGVGVVPFGIKVSGKKHSGTFDNTTFIRYENDVKYKNCIAKIEFQTKNGQNLFGKKNNITYSCDFYYPKLVKGQKGLFVWEKKKLKNSIMLSFGTEEMKNKIQETIKQIRYSFVAIYFLLLCVVLFFINKEVRED